MVIVGPWAWPWTMLCSALLCCALLCLAVGPYALLYAALRCSALLCSLLVYLVERKLLGRFSSNFRNK